MKMFHISDVLSATSGRLVSARHMDGVYEIYNFLTSDSLFTHQLPRAFRESEEWLRSQFPDLMSDAPRMTVLLASLDERLKPVAGDREKIAPVIASWVEEVRTTFALPIELAVYELGSDMHTRIDPIEEAEAMFGKDRVIVVAPEESAS